MAQHDYVLDNATGANFRSDLNNALLAISSNNSGSSAPSTTYALQFYADTTNNILKLRNAANDGFINLFTLAGGVDVDAASNFNEDVTFTGASANIVFDKSDNQLEFADNAKASFGGSGDLEIFHDSSESVINEKGVGTLKFQISGVTKAELVSGGLTVTDTVTATTLAGTLSTAAQTNVTSLGTLTGLTISGDTTFTGASANIIFDKSDNSIGFADNAKATFGNSGDLDIFHNGTNSIIQNSTGSFKILLNSDDNAIIADQDGAVELYHDNSKKLQTQSGGVRVFGDLENHNDNFVAKDSCKFAAGNSEDLTIFHDGSNSQIDNNTGTFIIRSDGGGMKLLSEANIILRDNDDTTNMVRCINGGQIELYHNGSKKAETVSGGFTVTGTCTATAFSGDGSGLTGVGGNTINNNADNRVITGSGTSGTLNGETNLTFNGASLFLTGTTDGVLNLDTTDSRGSFIRFRQGGGQDTNKCFVGCGDGLSAGDVNDLALVSDSGGIFFRANGSERMRIADNGFVTLAGDTDTGIKNTGTNTLQVHTNDTLCTEFSSNQRVRMPQVFSTAGSSMRDVQCESDGTLACLTSITESKINIADVTDVSWLYNLKPKTFNFRKKTVDAVTGVNTYLNEAEDEKAYGLLAEDVETINKDFCFYSKDSEGNDVLQGVYYKTMVVPLLKAVQDLKAENTALTTRVAALEAA